MIEDVVRARQALEFAQTTVERLWAELTAYCKTLDPGRGVADEEELRLLREASQWQRRVYAAEHELFSAEHGTPGVVGVRGEYQWLSMVDRDITSALTICPDLVLGKYLAVTRIDSGPLRLTEQEKRDGWWTTASGRVFESTSWSVPEYREDWLAAYSPRIESIHGLPNETHDECCAGFDEWYVFEQHAPAEDIESFVNWAGFRLYNPEFALGAERFWSQIDRLRPESYLAEGTVFTLVTRNPDLFHSVVSAYEATP